MFILIISLGTTIWASRLLDAGMSAHTHADVQNGTTAHNSENKLVATATTLKAMEMGNRCHSNLESKCPKCQ